MAEQEISPGFLDGLETDAGSPGSGLSRFRIRLEMVRGKYGEDEIRFPKLIMTYLSRSEQGTSQPLGIQLALELEPEAAAALAQIFPALEGIINDYSTFLFEMKPDVFLQYAEAFDKAIRLEDWFLPGSGAIVDLQNYNCLGYIDLQGEFETTA